MPTRVAGAAGKTSARRKWQAIGPHIASPPPADSRISRDFRPYRNTRRSDRSCRQYSRRSSANVCSPVQIIADHRVAGPVQTVVPTGVSGMRIGQLRDEEICSAAAPRPPMRTRPEIRNHNRAPEPSRSHHRTGTVIASARPASEGLMCVVCRLSHTPQIAMNRELRFRAGRNSHVEHVDR